MKQADDMHLVRQQIPSSLLQRLRLPLEKQKFEERMKSWIYAAPLEHLREGYKKSLKGNYTKVKPPLEWKGKPAGWDDRTLKIVLEMEALWGRKLARGADGCPFPGHPRSMPTDWGFWICWTFLAESVQTMWIRCNSRWPQVDNAETLFLSACLHALDPSHQEWLNLLLSFLSGHPFRISCAHKHHNKMLRSGWTTILPTSLADYDEALNNLLVETQFSNWFKNNALESEYGRAKDHLLSINLPKELYNPAKLLRPNHRQGSCYEPWSIDKPQEFAGQRQTMLPPRISQNQVPHPAQDSASTSLPVSHQGVKVSAQIEMVSSAIRFLYLLEPLRRAIHSFDYSRQVTSSSKPVLARIDLILTLRSAFKLLDVETSGPVDTEPLLKCFGDLLSLLTSTGGQTPRLSWEFPNVHCLQVFIFWLLSELSEEERMSHAMSKLTQQRAEHITKTACDMCSLPTSSPTVKPLAEQKVLSVHAQQGASAEHLSVLLCQEFSAVILKDEARCQKHPSGTKVEKTAQVFTHLPEYLMIQIDCSGILKRPEELDLTALFHSPDGNMGANYELEAEVCCKTKIGEAVRYFTCSNSSQLSDASHTTKLSRDDASTNFEHQTYQELILTGF
jgi:hypothetical protein